MNHKPLPVSEYCTFGTLQPANLLEAIGWPRQLNPKTITSQHGSAELACEVAAAFHTRDSGRYNYYDPPQAHNLQRRQLRQAQPRQVYSGPKRHYQIVETDSAKTAFQVGWL
jgi:hypothetical protein